MRYNHVFIEGIAHCLPDVVVRTSAIEKMLLASFERMGIPQGTILAMTGVQERRIWREGVSVADAATKAGRELLTESGFDPNKVTALISTSVSRDHLEPSVAALVHGALGLPHTCQNFDIGNACLGFLTALDWAAGAIESGQHQAIIVVAGESSRAVTQATTKKLLAENVNFENFRDNLATLTLGSASVACLLVHEKLATTSHRFEGATHAAATEFSHLCRGSNDGMKTDATQLLKNGVALAEKAYARAQEELDFKTADIAQFALHQVGIANHDAMLRAASIPEDRALRLYPTLGNVGAAGVPITLSTLAHTGKLAQNDRVLLMGIGSGLNVSIQSVRW